jgi:hypothetical protein
MFCLKVNMPPLSSPLHKFELSLMQYKCQNEKSEENKIFAKSQQWLLNPFLPVIAPVFSLVIRIWIPQIPCVVGYNDFNNLVMQTL